jgi:hypothetical protein
MKVSPSFVLVPRRTGTLRPQYAPLSTAAMGSLGTYAPSRVGPVPRKPSSTCARLVSSQSPTSPVAVFQAAAMACGGAARRHARAQALQFSSPQKVSAYTAAWLRFL